MIRWPAVALRTCTVSFADPSGIRHSVEVMAESIYEAAALGVSALREILGSLFVLTLRFTDQARGRMPSHRAPSWRFRCGNRPPLTGSPSGKFNAGVMASQ
jgi:hypothetical protein